MIINNKLIKKIDRGNMLDLLISFPAQCKRAMLIGKMLSIDERYKREYKNIVFLGLGGSAIGADIIKSYLVDECDIPIYVIRDYTIPKFVDKDSLVFATSYSGNTEETISMYKGAKERRANIIIITSGGKLEKLAKRNRNLLVTVPKGFPPRSALGYSFIPALVIISRLKIIRDKTRDIKNSVFLLKKLSREMINPNARINISKKIAALIYGKFPVIYAAAKHMDVAAVRWRGQLAENSKALSSMHIYPEMNHNEIVGWSNPYALLKKFVIITLRDKKDCPRVKKRMDISNSIFKKAKFKVIEINSKGNSLLSRILSLMYIGDFVSFYLSIMYKTDPTPVERIAYLKAQLTKR
ncbi:MAG: bifunctional phosphoglucose/phosphomannose isomerase [Candidatus Omnitrophica bacterium]|nr:bifunctional phosphoglucose/phosphomannose isomerase [Candidatus Omnitrophota bacterium]